MAKKRGSRRRKKESALIRVGRALNRLLIVVTSLLIALYVLPFSLGFLEETDDVVLSNAGEEVTVQVLNGCGEKGLALTITRFLRSHGFDVVEMGNADHFDYATTQVIARDDWESASRVRGVLGVGELVSQPDSTLLLDVTVIIGPDCKVRTNE